MTGRKFNGPGDYQDDNLDQNELGSDNVFDVAQSLYYVYDPTDNRDPNTGADISKPGEDDINGFNELEKRKASLCQLLILDCVSATKMLTMIKSTSHIPTGID